MADQVNKIESLVDALSFMNKAHEPDSTAYKIRNPILLKNYAQPGKNKITEEGLRIFDSHLGGYKSACYDIGIKVNGQSSVGLKPTDKLKNLLAVYGIKSEDAQMSVVFFLRKALDKSIDLSTELSYFIEKK